MMSYRKLSIFLILGILVCITLIISIFSQVEKSAVREMNDRQMIYARLAAKGIGSFLADHITMLQVLAANPDIADMNKAGKELFQTGKKIAGKYIKGMTRVSADGEIIYTFPVVAGAVGTNISGQAHVREVLRSRNLTVSDIFTTVQGFESVAIHVPVYRAGSFAGTVAFLISFEELAKDYLDNLFIPDDRYAVLINAQGKIIHCIKPAYRGHSLAEFFKHDAEAAGMLNRMREGLEGEAILLDTHFLADTPKAVQKYAVYAPVRAGNGFWSVAVISSKGLILPAAQTTQSQIIILALALIVFFAITIYIMARIRSRSIEEQERKKIETDLIKSAEEIHDLYHNAPCGYHSLDAAGNIVRINDTELSWLGYTREELVGKSYTLVLSDDGRDSFNQAFAALKQQGLLRNAEYELRRKDGTTFPVLVTASAVTDPQGNFVMSRSMVLDVTLRRLQEERLRESEALYRRALETGSDGISITQEGKYVYFNKKLTETIGRPDENLIGRTAGRYVHPDDRQWLANTYKASLAGAPLPSLTYELRIPKPDGTTAIVSVVDVPITYQGKPATLAFITDITQKKNYEAALRESEALYRTALESTSDGVTIFQDGKYVYVNQKFLDTLGVTRDALIYKSPGSLANPRHPDEVQEFLERRPCVESTPDMCVTRVLKPDGSTIYLQSSSVDAVYQGKPAILTFVQDVTERRKAEQVLRESEALYRTALETTSDGISIIDIQSGRYLYANQRLMNTIGRPAENIVGQPIDINLHPEDAGIGRNKYREIRDSGKGRVYYELRALKPDGSIVMMGITATETIYQGKEAIISFVSDVTEQRRTEEALRESEELYRTAMEKTNDGISIVQEGKYVYANQRLLKTLGRAGEEVVNQPLGVYMDPDSAEMLRKYFVARIQGKEAPASYDVRIMKPDASCIMLNVRAAKITYKGKPATISFVTDVTERRRAEEALRQSEERYRTIFESIDDDYFETDLEGVITFLNRPVSWTQFRRDELIGTKFGGYVTPEMARKISVVFNTIYRENKSLRIPECEIILKDGTTGHLEMSASPIRDANGLPVGFRGVTRDVSDRFKMEVEHRKLMEQLHQAQKMEAIGTLAGGIAHDFNNLLMGIQGYTSLMMLEIDPGHRYFEQLKAVQALVQSGAGLTRQLLGFARAGRYEILATDLTDLLSKSINLFGRTRKEIRIFENYAEDIWTVEVDRGQIEQVLLNLFVNAWQAMPGGGSLYIETNNILMEESLAKIYDLKSGRYVKISITDTGIGMDEKTRQRIFDPFFTTKEMGRGTGLGLASAYGIVKGHAGIITVYSEKGHGSTFNIYLPASSKTVARDESVEAEPASGLETILLVDDEEVITDVTGRLLRELGYTIKTAVNGEEAIKIYAEAHAGIDLVIIDMIMPGISGSDTFDRLKAINPSIRAILSSGYSLNGKAQDIMNKGVRAFLQKPYRLHDLARKIREVLAD